MVIKCIWFVETLMSLVYFCDCHFKAFRDIPFCVLLEWRRFSCQEHTELIVKERQ